MDCRRSTSWNRRNREIGAIGEPIDIGGVEVTGNTAILICRGSGITGKNRWIIYGVDGKVDRDGIIRVSVRYLNGKGIRTIIVGIRLVGEDLGR